MSGMINAVEVFRIAERIERDGSFFYRSTAVKFDRPELSELFNRLADWELTHERAFAAMRENLRSDVEWDDETCRSIASLSEFAIGIGPVHKQAAAAGVRNTIELAVKLEQDSVTFYKGLKGFVDDPAVVDVIDRIIAEEHQHIQMLREQL